MTTTRIEQDPILTSFCAVHDQSFAELISRILKDDQEAEQDLLTKLQWANSKAKENFFQQVIAMFADNTDSSLLSGSALNLLGYAYYYSEINRDVKKAHHFFYQAAEKEDASGLNNLGFMYQIGANVNKDEAKARDLYEQAAEKGNIGALYNLVQLFSCLTNNDAAKAHELRVQAAEKGNIGALYILGCAYQDGRLGISLAKDAAVSRAYYERAVKKGCVASLVKLGDIYRYGTMVEVQDKVRAIRYYEEAAEKGDLRALRNLGFIYAYEIFVEKDIEKASFYFRQSIIKSEAYDRRELLDIYRSNTHNQIICYHAAVGLGYHVRNRAEYYCDVLKTFQTIYQSHFQTFIQLLENESEEVFPVVLGLLNEKHRHQLVLKITVAYNCFMLTQDKANGVELPLEKFIDPTKECVGLPCEIFLTILELAFGKRLINEVTSKQIFAEEIHQERTANWKIRSLQAKISSVSNLWHSPDNKNILLHLKRNANRAESEEVIITTKEMEEIKKADKQEICYADALPQFMRKK